MLINLSRPKLFKMSVVKMKSELHHLTSHFCSLFSAAASSCTDIFSAVISSWFQIHIVALSCILLISHHFLSVIVFHRQSEWACHITAVLIHGIYFGSLTGNELCCSAHLITSQVKESCGAAEKQKGGWAYVLRLVFFLFSSIWSKFWFCALNSQAVCHISKLLIKIVIWA